MGSGLYDQLRELEPPAFDPGDLLIIQVVLDDDGIKYGEGPVFFHAFPDDFRIHLQEACDAAVRILQVSRLFPDNRRLEGRDVGGQDIPLAVLDEPTLSGQDDLPDTVGLGHLPILFVVQDLHLP